MEKKFREMETKLVHAGELTPKPCGAVTMPIFQSSTYEHHGVKDYDAVTYIRLNNTPNHQVLHQKLSAIENGEAALVTGSGMAAISATLLSVLSSGEHALFQNTLYGGTHTFVTQDFENFGLSYDFIDANQPSTWAAQIKPNTRAIYVESMTNPLLQVGDLSAVVSFARKNGLISVIDNTFASPVNFRPPEWGFDLSLHSGTKYLNGHTDIVAGAIIGRADLIQKITHKLNHLGGTLDPHACYLLYRGMKTLVLRVTHQNATAQRLAELLENHPAVQSVNYPGLDSSLSFALAKELFDGFGGMLSFELGEGEEATQAFLKRLRIPIVAPSLGGVESLVTLPATTSHSGLPPDERRALGISDGLIRVSVGIESAEELLEDFDRALSRPSAVA